MTARFANHWLGFNIFTLALSGVVLGLAANFASIFLPDYHRDFTIFLLVVPSLTILTFLIQIQWAQPQTEAVSLIILCILWLTSAAWSTDIIGNIQCDALKGQTIPTSNGHTTGFQPYCYKMKTVQALSWALFCAHAIAIVVLFQLVHRALPFLPYSWSESIRDLPWYGEIPTGYNSGYPGGVTYQQSPGVYYPPPTVQPGSSLIIQPGINGHPPFITQIPNNMPLQ